MFDEELVVSRKSGRCAYIENTSKYKHPMFHQHLVDRAFFFLRGNSWIFSIP